METNFTIRTQIKAGDIGQMIYWHELIYAQEYEFDWTFGSYVALTFSELAEKYNPEKDQIWIAEQNGVFVASIAILSRPNNQAQLRWLIVCPQARGQGIGKTLFEKALNFCKEKNYQEVYLLTVADLGISANMYQKAGFKIIEQKESFLWGKTQLEQKLLLSLK